MRMLITHRPRVAAVLVPTALLAASIGLAAPALAADGGRAAPAARTAPSSTQPTGLNAIKAASAAAIAARQASLSARLTMVTSGSPHLTAADRQALQSLIKADQSGLSALRRKIAADTDVTTAKADHKQIFTGYRVYALVMPQARLVRATDTVQTAVIPRLTDAQDRLAKALAAANKTGQASAQMADLATRRASITAAAGGLSAKLLALTPADWNSNHNVLAPMRQTLRQVRSDVLKARSDILAVEAVLKS